MKIKLVDYITEKAHDKKIEDLALLLTSFLDYITGCSVANTELKNLGGGIEGFVSDYIRFKTYFLASEENITFRIRMENNIDVDEDIKLAKIFKSFCDYLESFGSEYSITVQDDRGIFLNVIPINKIDAILRISKKGFDNFKITSKFGL